MSEAALQTLPHHNLLYYVFKLLRLRWIIFVSGFKHAKPIRKFFTILLGLLLIGGFVGALLGTAFILRLLYSPEVSQMVGDIGRLLDAIPVLIVSGAFLAILLTSFGVLLQALYLAGDMDFLLAAPVPIRAVFITKLLQAILSNLTLILIFGLPVLFGLGIAGKFNILYFPLVIIVLMFLALAAAGISSLLVMFVARIFPAKRVAEVLAFLGATISMVCSQWGNLSRGQNYEVTPDQLAQGTGVLASLNNAWSPLAWGGRALVDIGQGRWGTGMLYLILTLALAGGMFWIALVAAERLYYSGWASMQTGTQRKKKTRRAPAATAAQGLRTNPLSRILPSDVRAVMVKDFHMLRRDLRNMSQVITPLIFGIIYGVMMIRGGPEAFEGRGEAPETFMKAIEVLLSYGSVAISLFVGWSLLSRLALMAFSSEGASYWIIKTSPISATRLLVAKFLTAFIPATLLGWLFITVMGILQRPPLSVILYGYPAVALILAGLAGLNLAFGVAGAKLDWTDPRRMSSGASGCLSAIVSIAYLVIALAFFFGPPVGLPLMELPVWVSQIVGLLLGGALAITCALLPPYYVRDRVYKIGEA